jgi:indolepyruvate ferredoxin oxidoreductase alpha subunit
MTHFVVHHTVLLEMAAHRRRHDPAHHLVAPTLVRSQILSFLHEAAHRGELSAKEAQARRAWIDALPIRLLGDGSLRGKAWEMADRLGWPSTWDAEYLALTRLQADAFVTLDAALARVAEGVVPVAAFEALFEAG